MLDEQLKGDDRAGAEADDGGRFVAEVLGQSSQVVGVSIQSTIKPCGPCSWLREKPRRS